MRPSVDLVLAGVRGTPSVASIVLHAARARRRIRRRCPVPRNCRFRENVYLSGTLEWSFGGIQTVLTVKKELGLQAAIAFAPAAMTWNAAPEIQSRLIAAVRRP